MLSSKNLRWPPRATGLEAPILEALLGRRRPPPMTNRLLGALAVGAAFALVALLLDHWLFAGVSLPRIRQSATLPLSFRLAIPVYAALTEEALYRFGVMTVVVWIGGLVLPRRQPPPHPLAAWLGIVVAALLFGLAHVANVPDAPHPVARAVVLNGFAGTVLGWLYWKWGFEAAVSAHFAADVVIYLVVASLL